jgi:RNA polymerase sigma-70 factor (ECF subfamily)
MLTTSAHQILKNGASGAEEIPPEFWELVEQYREPLMRQALAMLGSREDAEDVGQETFVDAYKDREQFKNADSLGAWMAAVNRRNALTRARTKKRNKAKVSRKQTQAPAPVADTGGFSAIEQRDALVRASEKLEPNLRAVVYLRYFEHLSYQQIAERLNIPKGTVGYLLFEASAQLYERLHKPGAGGKP